MINVTLAQSYMKQRVRPRVHALFHWARLVRMHLCSLAICVFSRFRIIKGDAPQLAPQIHKAHDVAH